MSFFQFNRIYVIESLPDGERQTGTELHSDLLKWQTHNHPNLKTDIFNPKDRIEWDSILENIRKECETENTVPIIHFEVHGSSNKDGIILKSRQLITWNDLYNSLLEINTLTKMNLFLTMAVCYGACFMQEMRIDRAVPFYGLIGSFEVLKVSDLYIRYYEFYTEFLQSLALDKAFTKLREANPSMPADYRFISAEETFHKVYKGYIRNKATKKSDMQARALDAARENNITFTNRQEKRKFIADFKKKLVDTKDKYYKEHSSVFFMIDKFPENRARFNIPNTLNEFVNQKFS